jgi:hypothetical protein
VLRYKGNISDFVTVIKPGDKYCKNKPYIVNKKFQNIPIYGCVCKNSSI